MFIKHILKHFDDSTKLKYYIHGVLIKRYDTVSDYMNSGLTTYDSTENCKLAVENNAIIIRVT